MITKEDIAPMLDLLQTKLGQLGSFGYVQIYMDQLLQRFTQNEQLWTLYTNFALDQCSDETEKMRILRCSLKNCYSSVPLWLTYLRYMEVQ